ncbi:MAG: hypothetical protein IKT40_00995 [Bacilli bacterium]|jgi:hypothetical protein|nr:hypothetical protein [Bacilli bacterium]
MSETEVKTRKPSTKTYMLEIYDNNGNLIEGATFDKNIKVVAEMKKVDETVIDLIRDHPHAFFAKM